MVGSVDVGPGVGSGGVGKGKEECGKGPGGSDGGGYGLGRGGGVQAVGDWAVWCGHKILVPDSLNVAHVTPGYHDYHGGPDLKLTASDHDHVDEILG